MGAVIKSEFVVCEFFSLFTSKSKSGIYFPAQFFFYKILLAVHFSVVIEKDKKNGRKGICHQQELNRIELCPNFSQFLHG